MPLWMGLRSELSICLSLCQSKTLVVAEEFLGQISSWDWFEFLFLENFLFSSCDLTLYTCFAVRRFLFIQDNSQFHREGWLSGAGCSEGAQTGQRMVSISHFLSGAVPWEGQSCFFLSRPRLQLCQPQNLHKMHHSKELQCKFSQDSQSQDSSELIQPTLIWNWLQNRAFAAIFVVRQRRNIEELSQTPCNAHFENTCSQTFLEDYL